MLYYKKNERLVTCSVMLNLICGVLSPGKLLPSPMEPIADSLAKHRFLVGGVLLCNCLSSPLKEAVAESTITTRYGMC